MREIAMKKEVEELVEEFSQELRLLLAFLEMEEEAELTFEHWELLQEVDWHKFIELARHHRVFPTISQRLQNRKPPYVPQFVTSLFQRDYYRNTLSMLALSGEMEQLATTFSTGGIKALFLKGPVIAADLYGDVSLRTSCDLDVLVELNQVEAAQKLLLERGYEKDEYIETILNDWTWRHHHYVYNHPQKEIKVEVHWRLNPFPSREPKFEELWERRRQSALINRPIYYLGGEDLFLFLVSHGARHGWARLRWLLDIKQLSNQKLDWTVLPALLHKFQLAAVGGQALWLASRLIGAPLREEMKPLLQSRRAEWLAEDALFYIRRKVNLHSPPVPRDVESYHKKYLFALMPLGQRLKFVASMLHPYPEDARTLPLPKRLHFLYFPLRPFLLVWRRMKRLSRWSGSQMSK